MFYAVKVLFHLSGNPACHLPIANAAPVSSLLRVIREGEESNKMLAGAVLTKLTGRRARGPNARSDS